MLPFRSLAIYVLIFSFLPALVIAQGPGPRGDSAWGIRGAYQRMYDPKTVESFRGVVLAVDTFFLGRGSRGGLHLRIKRPADTIAVHLGPIWYLEGQELAIAANDTLTIKGSRTVFEGRPAVIASEIMRGADTLVLRDSRGIPAWSGWRRRHAR
ncbi:MAG TPA: DNA-binding protein [Fibrobacteria bacterium]|nr:DNA-binding protein [Fibrobacteria bacterium]